MVEGRFVPWDLLVKDVPKEKQHDLDYLVEQLDWDLNTDTHFRQHHYLEPVAVADSANEGWLDRWITYGSIDGRQRFSAKELTLQPGVKRTDKRRRCLRAHHCAGKRTHWEDAAGHARHDPLRGDDGG